MNNAFFDKIADLKKKIPEAIKRLPGIAKVEGLRFIADNFAQEGFETDTGRYRVWPEKKAKGSRKKTLVGEKRGGRLKRSWKDNSKERANVVEFASALPYAEVHNEGLMAGRGGGFQMPRREMIGPSEALNKRIDKKFSELADKILK